MRAPTKPSGSGLEAKFLGDLCDAINANRIAPSADYRIRESPSGTVLEIPRQISAEFFYPFKLYQFPAGLRKFQNSDDWRRVKVHNGLIHSEDTSVSGGLAIAWTAYGADGTNDRDLFTQDYNTAVYQLPPTDNSSVIVGQWNEAIIPDDGSVYDFWFSFIDGQHDPNGITWLNGLFYGKTFGTNGTDGTATFLYDGSTCSPISYRGYSDLYNIKIGSAYTLNGKLYIQQQLFQHPLVVPHPFIPGRPQWRGAYSGVHSYYVGDLVYLDDNGSSSHDFRTVWMYYPPSSASSYYPTALMGPITGVSPIGNSPDPWFRVSRSPIATSGTDPAWTTGAYDATKYYLRGT